MNWRSIAAGLLGGTALLAAPAAHAADCKDLWYARHLVLVKAGVCFEDPVARATFSDFPCWTEEARLSDAQQAKLDGIVAKEESQNCATKS